MYARNNTWILIHCSRIMDQRRVTELAPAQMPLDMDTHEITRMQDDPVLLVPTINRYFTGGTHHSNGLPGTGRSSRTPKRTPSWKRPPTAAAYLVLTGAKLRPSFLISLGKLDPVVSKEQPRFLVKLVG
jgi:hypothetical protein